MNRDQCVHRNSEFVRLDFAIWVGCGYVYKLLTRQLIFVCFNTAFEVLLLRYVFISNCVNNIFNNLIVFVGAYFGLLN